MPNNNGLNAQETLARIDHLERRGNRVGYILAALLILTMIAPVLATLWIQSKYPTVESVTLSNIAITGEHFLCPGDKLRIEVTLHAEGDGILVLDRTIRSTAPPRTIIFSVPMRDILDAPIHERFSVAWTVPKTYWDFTEDEIVPFPPGEYVQRFSVASPTLSTIFSSQQVTFTVQEDSVCN